MLPLVIKQPLSGAEAHVVSVPQNLVEPASIQSGFTGQLRKQAAISVRLYVLNDFFAYVHAAKIRKLLLIVKNNLGALSLHIA